MSFSEFIRLMGNDWGLALLSLILLYMFVKRLQKVKDFLAIAGSISTIILLLMLAFIQWSRYSTAVTIYDIINNEPSAYSIMTTKSEVLEQPAIVSSDDVRYIIDTSKETPKRHYAWDLVAIPRN